MVAGQGDCGLILHIDVDAFFASVEQLLIPSLRGRPVLVGSGVIASCSYEARKHGCRAGMALHEAQRVCPEAAVLAGDAQIYRCFAEHVWAVTARYAGELETYLDEAYGNAAGLERTYGDPLQLGRSLQRAVREEVGLPVSVGLGRNRMLAKIASAAAKPGGVVWIAPGDEDRFLTALPIRKLPGVGHTTERQLRDMNIATVGDLRRLSRAVLRGMFGLRGEELYDRARGDDARVLRPERLPRSISRETTFHAPTCDLREIRGMISYLLERAMRSVREGGLLTGAAELRIRYDDWKSYDAQRTLPAPTDADEDVQAILDDLLPRLHTRRVALRHVGVVLSKFTRASERGRLFESDTERHHRDLHRTLDAIRDRYGHAAVVSGPSIHLLRSLERNDHGFVLRTPSLTK